MSLTNDMIAALRKDYKSKPFEMADAQANPFTQFGQWFEEALQAEIPEPNAMTLATATPQGLPKARIVLLKGFDETGFRFFTNYDSDKGQELKANPHAALVFVWLDLSRQIRIEGAVECLSFEASQSYFQSRPKKSQIGAWASSQSTQIPDRSVLENKVAELEKEYANKGVLPCPPHWGGYKVVPNKIEFWQGRRSRLHDRLVYNLQKDGSWKIERLAP